MRFLSSLAGHILYVLFLAMALPAVVAIYLCAGAGETMSMLFSLKEKENDMSKINTEEEA